jgi:hypothetical protein
MKFSELTFTTKFKLLAGNILLIGGLVMLATSPEIIQGLTMLVAGNLFHLDGRISRLEEIESKFNRLTPKN